MIRIWAKLVRDDKIIKDTIYENPAVFNIDNFYNYITDIAESLQIATPITLSKHLNYFMDFNTTTYLPSDFPETIDFDKFVLEQANI